MIDFELRVPCYHGEAEDIDMAAKVDRATEARGSARVASERRPATHSDAALGEAVHTLFGLAFAVHADVTVAAAVHAGIAVAIAVHTDAGPALAEDTYAGACPERVEADISRWHIQVHEVVGVDDACSDDTDGLPKRRSQHTELGKAAMTVHACNSAAASLSHHSTTHCP